MIWTIGAFAVCLCICLPLYIYYKRTLHLHLACCYKSLGTLCCFLMALIAAVRLDPRCWMCVVAILIYAAADYVLEFNFIFGAGIFLAGHICNIAFFLNLSPLSTVHFVAVLVLGGTALFVCYRWRKPIGKQMASFLVYGVSLVLMASCAFGCFMLNTAMGILIACGGALFFVSDIVLLRRVLFPSGNLIDWFIMITYYSSVLLFGLSCLLI